MTDIIHRLADMIRPNFKTDDLGWLNTLTLNIRSYIQPKLPCTFDADEVFENIYVGSYSAALSRKELFEHGITHILSVANLRPGYPDQFIYKTLAYRDSTTENLFDHLDDAHAFIHSATENGKILIHCVYGVSRSTSILISYLIKVYNYNYEEALEMIREKRPQANPNPAFVAQLKAYEKCLIPMSDNWVVITL